MTTVLVIGANGYLGRALVSASSGAVRFLGASRTNAPGLLTVDPFDVSGVTAVIERHEVDAVVNAAGRATGSDAELRDANTVLVDRLIAATTATGRRLITIGSAAEYGAAAMHGPLSEVTIELPLTEYARTKWKATELVRAAARRGIDAMVARVFNVAGPGLPMTSPLGSFARAVSALPTTGGVVSIRNARTARDYVSLPFITEAIAALASQPQRSAVVNICSGAGLTYRDVVEALAAESGVPVTIEDLQEPQPISSVTGDPTLLDRHYGLRELMGARSVARHALGRTTGSTAL